MKTYLFFILLILYGKNSFCQVLSKTDSCIISKAAKISSKGMLDENSGRLVLMIAHRVLRVDYFGNTFYIFRGDLEFDHGLQDYKLINMDTLILRKSKKMEQCFTKEICSPRFYYLEDFRRDGGEPTSDSNYIYFNLIKLGKKEFEFCLPFSNMSTPAENSFILDKDVFRYLSRLTTSKSRKKK